MRGDVCLQYHTINSNYKCSNTLLHVIQSILPTFNSYTGIEIKLFSSIIRRVNWSQIRIFNIINTRLQNCLTSLGILIVLVSPFACILFVCMTVAIKSGNLIKPYIFQRNALFRFCTAYFIPLHSRVHVYHILQYLFYYLNLCTRSLS